MAKKALIIYTSVQVPGLPPLGATKQDAQNLRELLTDNQFGEYDPDNVTVSADEGLVEVQSKIGDFFRKAASDDFLLLYFAGHGAVDDNKLLYLILRDTKHKGMSDTALTSSFIHGHLRESKSSQKLIILDCCHAGAFINQSAYSTRDVFGVNEARASLDRLHPHSGAAAAPIPRTTGKTTVVMGACQHNQQSIQRTRIDDAHGLYTSFLIGGVKSGLISPEGRVKTSLAHNYLCSKFPAADLVPYIWTSASEEDLEIVANPIGAANQKLISKLTNKDFDIRKANFDSLYALVSNEKNYLNYAPVIDEIKRRKQKVGDPGAHDNVSITEINAALSQKIDNIIAVFDGRVRREKNIFFKLLKKLKSIWSSVLTILAAVFILIVVLVFPPKLSDIQSRVENFFKSSISNVQDGYNWFFNNNIDPEANWFTTLATFKSDNPKALSMIKDEARKISAKITENDSSLPTTFEVWKRANRKYAFTLGDATSKEAAKKLAKRIKEKGIDKDAYATKNKGWLKVMSLPSSSERPLEDFQVFVHVPPNSNIAEYQQEIEVLLASLGATRVGFDAEIDPYEPGIDYPSDFKGSRRAAQALADHLERNESLGAHFQFGSVRPQSSMTSEFKLGLWLVEKSELETVGSNEPR